MHIHSYYLQWFIKNHFAVVKIYNHGWLFNSVKYCLCCNYQHVFNFMGSSFVLLFCSLQLSDTTGFKYFVCFLLLIYGITSHKSGSLAFNVQACKVWKKCSLVPDLHTSCLGLFQKQLSMFRILPSSVHCYPFCTARLYINLLSHLVYLHTNME